MRGAGGRTRLVLRHRVRGGGQRRQIGCWAEGFRPQPARARLSRDDGLPARVDPLCDRSADAVGRRERRRRHGRPDVGPVHPHRAEALRRRRVPEHGRRRARRRAAPDRRRVVGLPPLHPERRATQASTPARTAATSPPGTASCSATRRASTPIRAESAARRAASEAARASPTGSARRARASRRRW